MNPSIDDNLNMLSNSGSGGNVVLDDEERDESLADDGGVHQNNDDLLLQVYPREILEKTLEDLVRGTETSGADDLHLCEAIDVAKPKDGETVPPRPLKHVVDGATYALKRASAHRGVYYEVAREEIGSDLGSDIETNVDVWLLQGDKKQSHITLYSRHCAKLYTPSAKVIQACLEEAGFGNEQFKKIAVELSEQKKESVENAALEQKKESVENGALEQQEESVENGAESTNNERETTAVDRAPVADREMAFALDTWFALSDEEKHDDATRSVLQTQWSLALGIEQEATVLENLLSPDKLPVSTMSKVFELYDLQSQHKATRTKLDKAIMGYSGMGKADQIYNDKCSRKKLLENAEVLQTTEAAASLAAKVADSALPVAQRIALVDYALTVEKATLKHTKASLAHVDSEIEFTRLGEM